MPLLHGVLDVFVFEAKVNLAVSAYSADGSLHGDLQSSHCWGVHNCRRPATLLVPVNPAAAC